MGAEAAKYSRTDGVAAERGWRLLEEELRRRLGMEEVPVR